LYARRLAPAQRAKRRLLFPLLASWGVAHGFSDEDIIAASAGLVASVRQWKESLAPWLNLPGQRYTDPLWKRAFQIGRPRAHDQVARWARAPHPFSRWKHTRIYRAAEKRLRVIAARRAVLSFRGLAGRSKDRALREKRARVLRHLSLTAFYTPPRVVRMLAEPDARNAHCIFCLTRAPCLRHGEACRRPIKQARCSPVRHDCGRP